MKLNEMINEAKDLNLYKKILRVLGGYSDKFPATGVSKMFKAALDKGIKCIPKDKRALGILSCIVDSGESIPTQVQKILNLRFSDLEHSCRPIYKDGNAKQVAFWNVDGQVHDKVLSLLNFDGKAGSWSDAESKKVSLIDIQDKKQ